MTRRFHPTMAALLALFISTSISAQQTKPEETAADAVWAAASAARQDGPTTIQLRDQARLELPEGYAFIPVKEGKAVMELMGNQTDERFLGLVFPSTEANWFVTVDYEASGYIKDDDAKNWNADELLKSLKEGTEAANEHRKEMGIAPIEVTRWVESPKYDSPTHRLIWSAESRDKVGATPDPTINYNTYVLGREGYVSLDLITASSAIDADRKVAHQLLGGINFNEGKRYADFNSSTDKVAAYGLAALVGGLAAKKLGLLAVIGAFLLKFAKVIFVAIAASGGALAKFVKGRKDAAESAS